MLVEVCDPMYLKGKIMTLSDFGTSLDDTVNSRPT